MLVLLLLVVRWMGWGLGLAFYFGEEMFCHGLSHLAHATNRYNGDWGCHGGVWTVFWLHDDGCEYPGGIANLLELSIGMSHYNIYLYRSYDHVPKEVLILDKSCGSTFWAKLAACFPI